jgi:hypothetical protein
VQAAFEVAEEYGYGLDALFVRKILEPFFLEGVSGNAVFPLFLSFEIEVFQFFIAKCQKVA